LVGFYWAWVVVGEGGVVCARSKCFKASEL
jgi:hypothetical protein